MTPKQCEDIWKHIVETIVFGGTPSRAECVWMVDEITRLKAELARKETIRDWLDRTGVRGALARLDAETKAQPREQP